MIGRAEVLRGNATFGIFGDGKEVAQIAMAKAFRPGDWRAGYYRDQTFMWATRMSNVRAFFAQLYGNASLDADPASGGRQMGNHFATRFLDDRGEFERSVDMPNSSADVSNVAGWMAREIKATVPDSDRVIAGPHVAGGMTMPPEVIVEHIQRTLGKSVATLAGRGS